VVNTKFRAFNQRDYLGTTYWNAKERKHFEDEKTSNHILTFLFLTSCGPRRMRCGYRCSIEKFEKKEIFC
jgi:hypothetical protein